ncbi:hybrid sensor histidine kinase/response regulator transcription factor [Wenyingzhuangia sp. IMCC45467]
MNITFFWCLFLLVSNLSFSQHQNGIAGKESYNVSYLDINNGLANNSVTAIYKDKRGLMWFGTYDGVSRYNAYDFVNYRNQPNDTTTLVNNKITSINGTLNNVWIGTKNGISVYNYLTNKFERKYFYNKGITETITYEVSDIKEFNSNIYIATRGQGLFCFKDESKHLKKILLSSNDEIISDYDVKGIDFDSSGRLWVVVKNWGLGVVEFGENVLKIVDNRIGDGNCIEVDDLFNIWIGADKGVNTYNISTKRLNYISDELIQYPIRNIWSDVNTKELWIATDGNSVVKYNLKTREFVRPFDIHNMKEKGISSNAITTIYKDKHRFWIGTLRGGIDVLEQKTTPFTTISKKQNVNNSLPSNFVLSFAEQDKENIWVGTDGGGVGLWNRLNNTFTNYKYQPNQKNSLPNNFVTGIKSTSNGAWIGTYGGGICFFNTTTKKFKKYNLKNEQTQVLEENVWKLFVTKKGDLWVSTHNGGEGLFKYNQKTDQFDYVNIGVVGVLCFSQDENNDLWVGTFRDLIKLDLKKNEHQFINTKYPVQCIYLHSNNKMLVGTEGGGLIVFNPINKEKKQLTEVDGISNNSILNIEKDNQGLYWLSTYNGITKYNADNNAIVKYYDLDGLQSNQFNYNASLKLSTGEILMGGIKGFNIINTGVFTTPKDFPQLMITSIKVNNKPLNELGKTVFGVDNLKLSFDESMLTVFYAGLDYSTPEKISYAYFLEGWDTEWHNVGKIRTANYSKLTEGNYVLKIKSTNADGVWNTNITSLSVCVLPPWYRTFWAYFAYVLLFISGVFAVDKYQRKQEKLKYEIKLSKDLAIQEKQLNEKKSTFFTNISHEFRAPLTMIINPLRDIVNNNDSKVDLNVIDVVYRNSRRLLSLVDQLLLFRKTETETGKLVIGKMELVGLCKEVFTCFTNHAKTKNINYVFSSDTEEIYVYADRQKLEIALFNLITNALKFTEKEDGKVEVVLNTKDPNNIYLSVVDNGKGISQNDKKRIFDLFYQTQAVDKSNRKGFGIGLYLVKEFVEQHKGNVVCFDTKNGGTTFEINLRKGKSHFKDIVISEEIEIEPVVFVEEVIEDKTIIEDTKSYKEVNELINELKKILIVDDNPEIRKYLKNILSAKYSITTAENAEEAIKIVNKTTFDLILSDVVMGKISGVDFCKHIKSTEGLKHIPVILLSGGSTEGVKLESAEVGADDYITKPFDKDYLLARINGILTRRENVQNHLLNTVTKSISSPKLSDEDKLLLDKIVEVIENKMDQENFNIKILASEIGMSHSLLYKKIKKITGKSATEFTRGIRLRKVATLLITTDMQINQIASLAGFGDLKYFRKQFQQFYEMNPSEFKKKYQNIKDKKYIINDNFWK